MSCSGGGDFIDPDKDFHYQNSLQTSLSSLSALIECAIKSASQYVVHGKRNTLTSYDIQIGLMYHIKYLYNEDSEFLNLAKSTFLGESKSIFDEIAGDTSSSDEKDQEIQENDDKPKNKSDESESDDESESEDTFEISQCSCDKCENMSKTFQSWNQWDPTDELQIYLKSKIL